MSDVLQPGYVVHRPQPSAANAVHALIVASDIAEFGESQGYGIDDIESEWKQIDLERDVWVVLAPDGALAGYGTIQHRRHIRLDVEIYIHPAHFDRGIGTSLIRLAEERAREHVPLAPPEARVALNNWINALNAGACSLLEREGYTPVRYFWRMEADLGDEPQAPVWPAGIRVRAAAPGEDLRTFYDVSEGAMADHWGHVDTTFEEWCERRRTRQNFDPEIWFLVMDGDEPAGAALCSTSDGLGWIDTLAVLRPWRRRGLGSALLHHVFREFHRRGMPRIVLGVDAANPTGATQLYERAGMRVSQQYATYGKELRPGVDL